MTSSKLRITILLFLLRTNRVSSPSSNFLRDYKPINETTKFLFLHLTFGSLDWCRYWKNQQISENPFAQFGNVRVMKYTAGFFGRFDRRLIQTQDDQDEVRRKLIDADFDLNGFGVLSRCGQNSDAISVFLFFVSCFLFSALFLQLLFEGLGTGLYNYTNLL